MEPPWPHRAACQRQESNPSALVLASGTGPLSTSSKGALSYAAAAAKPKERQRHAHLEPDVCREGQTALPFLSCWGPSYRIPISAGRQ